MISTNSGLSIRISENPLIFLYFPQVCYHKKLRFPLFLPICAEIRALHTRLHHTDGVSLRLKQSLLFYT